MGFWRCSATTSKKPSSFGDFQSHACMIANCNGFVPSFRMQSQKLLFLQRTQLAFGWPSAVHASTRPLHVRVWSWLRSRPRTAKFWDEWNDDACERISIVSAACVAPWAWQWPKLLHRPSCESTPCEEAGSILKKNMIVAIPKYHRSGKRPLYLALYFLIKKAYWRCTWIYRTPADPHIIDLSKGIKN